MTIASPLLACITRKVTGLNHVTTKAARRFRQVWGGVSREEGEVSCLAHNQDKVGSIPIPATILMVVPC